MKNKLKKYYELMLNKKISPYSRIVNFYLKRILTFISTLVIMIIFQINVYVALYFSFLILAFYHYSDKKIESKKLNNYISFLRDKISQEIFWKKIKSMDEEDFNIFIGDLLESLPQFSEIRETYFNNQAVDFIVKFNESEIPIKSHLLDGENAVEAYSAREFSRYMSKHKYKKGIIISTTDFRENTKSYCELITEKRKINLLGKNDLYQMAIEAGKNPTKHEIDDAILKRIEYRERAFKNAQKKIFAKSNSSNYILAGTFLLLFSIFISGTTNYIYYLASLFLFVFAAVSFLLGIKKEKNNYNWQDKII